MAVNIVKKPCGVDFIKNDLEFVFKGNNIQVSGMNSSHKIVFNTQPAIGKYFVLKINDKSYSFVIVDKSSSGSIYTLFLTNASIDKDDFLEKLQANYHISKDFNVSITIESGKLTIKFDSKVPGTNTFVVTTSDNSFSISVVPISMGIPRIYKKNYKLFTQFNVEYLKNGSTVNEKSPEIILDVDNDGYATLNLDILNNISDDIDTPSSFYLKYGKYILNNMLIKFSLDYSEMYDDNNNYPIKWLKKSNEFIGIKGLISTSGKNLNKPDWNDIFQHTISKCELIRLYGCDNNQTFFSHKDGKDYLYLSLFDTSKPKTYSKILKGTLSFTLSNSTFQILQLLEDIEIKNFSIVRIPVHLQALPILNKTNVLKYTIAMWNMDSNENVIKRTFIIKQANHILHEFLLQNKYGVLEYFYTDAKKTESLVKADEIVINNLNLLKITEKNKTFTVYTGFKHYNQLKTIEQAARNNHNFMVINDKLVPIYIMPESITTLDENKELQETQFKFRFKDDNTEEIVIQNLITTKPQYDEITISTIENPLEKIWKDNLESLEVGTIVLKTAYWDDRYKFNESEIQNIWYSNK